MDLTGTIDRIEKVVLEFKRPRIIGRNARIGVHGDTVTDPIVRLTCSSGAVGVGWSRIDRQEAQALVGQAVSALIDETGSVPPGEIDRPPPVGSRSAPVQPAFVPTAGRKGRQRNRTLRRLNLH